jgi:hypothetical protein
MSNTRGPRARDEYLPTINRYLILVGLGSAAVAGGLIFSHNTKAHYEQHVAVNAQNVGLSEQATQHFANAQAEQQEAASITASAICGLTTIGIAGVGIGTLNAALRRTRF